MGSNKIKSLFEYLKKNPKLNQAVLIPLVTAILPICLQNKQAYCGFVLIVMSLYWIAECIPYAITSLLPVALFPMFGIMSSKQVSQIYFQDILMLYFGGLVLAICVETSNLHKRIAFKVIMFFGSNPLWLLLGIMSVTGFLSLWISNVASASMMLPITIAVVKQLTKLDKTFSGKLPQVNSGTDNLAFEIGKSEKRLDNTLEIEEVNETSKNNHDDDDELPNTPEAKKLMKGFCLSLTYSASVGGSGSLVGTAPNLILKGFFDEYHPDAGLNFFTFMLYSLPAAVLMIIIMWVTIAIFWLPRKYLLSLKKTKKDDKPQEKDELQEYIRIECEKQGPVTWEQASVGVLFAILVVLWLSRDLYFVPGWGSFFIKKFVTDTTPVILVVYFLVSWPKENIFRGRPYENLVSWKKINDNFPWNVILLGGGGLALAEGFEKSKLSELIGEILQKIMPNQKALALLIILIFCLIGTEFTSNTSMASIFIPIADSLAKLNNITPSYLLLPLTLSTSYAFMLPVATPTNAIVYGTNYLTIKDMFISGGLLKMIGIVVLYISLLWLNLIFKDNTVKNVFVTNATSLLFTTTESPN